MKIKRLIYNIGKARFGVKEVKQKSHPAGPSKRQKKCKLKKLKLKKRAESIKQNRKKLSRNCTEFLSQPFDFFIGR